jgi:YHS domain-containing protein
MIRYLVLVLVIYAAYKLFSNSIKHKRQEAEKEQQKKGETTAASDLVKDPICGTFVSKNDSVSVKDGDKTFHFCSYDCRDVFLDKISRDKDGQKLIEAKKVPAEKSDKEESEKK